MKIIVMIMIAVLHLTKQEPAYLNETSIRLGGGVEIRSAMKKFAVRRRTFKIIINKTIIIIIRFKFIN